MLSLSVSPLYGDTARVHVDFVAQNDEGEVFWVARRRLDKELVAPWVQGLKRRVIERIPSVIIDWLNWLIVILKMFFFLLTQTTVAVEYERLEQGGAKRDSVFLMSTYSKRDGVGDIEAKGAAVSAAIKGNAEALKPLLAGRVPNLHRH